MRIGILTHPLHSNYGGILQAYALSTVLKRMGHETLFFNRKPNTPIYKRWAWTLIEKFHIPPFYQRAHAQDSSNRTEHSFIAKHINRTNPLETSHQMWNVCKKNQLEAVVVGSDQVWRADFAINYGLDYFFGFIPQASPIKRVSYAASFGIDSWGYDVPTTRRIKQLIKRFSGISVREYEGIDLCKENLGVQVQLVLDPTLLLSADDYSAIASKQKASKYVFVYWLGDREKLKTILQTVDSSLQIIEIKLRSRDALPSVEDWLSYIKYAEYIITDSFHGCVFSIIFQKQFKVYLNNFSSNCRMKSLFKLFSLEDKLVNWNSDVDYNALNEKLTLLRANANAFLYSNL